MSKPSNFWAETQTFKNLEKDISFRKDGSFCILTFFSWNGVTFYFFCRLVSDVLSARQAKRIFDTNATFRFGLYTRFQTSSTKVIIHIYIYLERNKLDQNPLRIYVFQLSRLLFIVLIKWHIQIFLWQVRHFYKKLFFNPGHTSDPKEKVSSVR